MGGAAVYIYSNKLDPRNKTGGVAWLLLNKKLEGKLSKEIWNQNKTKKVAVKI
jgi:hypothetical protein